MKAAVFGRGTVCYIACLLGICLALCAGCTHTADIVRALSTDTNSVSVEVASPWGTVHYSRNVHRVP